MNSTGVPFLTDSASQLVSPHAAVRIGLADLLGVSRAVDAGAVKNS